MKSFVVILEMTGELNKLKRNLPSNEGRFLSYVIHWNQLAPIYFP